ncbi:hypothetical protein V7S43_006548 [Phytophthora oleae]|uniref:Uncharacterized protein n=1 Tax=Phytophthora oleae TaxID=2107226 RepID=A0ABD3FRU8_9STRA
MEERNSTNVTSTPEKKDANALDDSITHHEPVGNHTEATKLTAGYAARMSSKPPLELHRRCAETIERCSARLRERQRKMDRLQLLLPIPKAGNSKEDRRRATPQARSTPPRPTKRNKHGSVVLNSRSPAWSISSTRSPSSTRQRFNHMTPPHVNRNLNGPAKMRGSLGATPNTSPSNPDENNKAQESTPTATSRSEDTLELSLTDKSTDSPQKKLSVLSPTWSQRQQDFMAAIEAEADSDGMNATDGDQILE